MANTDFRAPRNTEAPRKPQRDSEEAAIRHQDLLFDENDEGGSWDTDSPEDSSPLSPGKGFRDDAGEKAEFLDQFDEDLYTDREDPPTQGNTADVAMGEGRFGSDGEAYAEYAHRRPGEDSSVGMSRDPADIAADADTEAADEDEQP
jgi:hypothetical protein